MQIKIYIQWKFIKITVVTNDLRMLCRINMYKLKWLYKSNQDIFTYHFLPTVRFENEECGFKIYNGQNRIEWKNVIKLLQVESKS